MSGCEALETSDGCVVCAGCVMCVDGCEACVGCVVTERCRLLFSDAPTDDDDDVTFLFSQGTTYSLNLDFSGCCHCHSNCKANILFGNPSTMATCSQGLSRAVRHAPPRFNSPLCCLRRRCGSVEKPMYVERALGVLTERRR